MWEQSLLTSSGQVEALRLLSDWWDSRRRPLRGRRRNLTARGATVADVLLQRVPEHSRDKNAVHLDLETDDPQAETARLTSLGASRDRPQGTTVVPGATPTGP